MESSMPAGSANVLTFLQLVGRLKHLKRTGWVLRNVQDPESIAGHMYRMGILTLLLDDDDGLDKNRCIKMALVHDLAECIVGDITPKCGVEPAEKHRREDEAMKQLAELVGTAGTELYNLYKEYETQESAEAKFVKELDRFDMVLQAFEYEKCEKRPHEHEEFFESTQGKFSHPLLTPLLKELEQQRLEFEAQNGVADQ